MRDAVAADRYLQRYIEADLPEAPAAVTPWRHVLVLPAYRESSQLLKRLLDIDTQGAPCLVVLVLNRPDSDSEATANATLRDAVTSRCSHKHALNGATVFQLVELVDLCLLDLDHLRGPLPGKEGVGLARKYGCDLAFKWISGGAIESHWIHSTDADATLPAGYFSRTENCEKHTVAAVYPFVHTPGENDSINIAAALYELRLHHYVLGLEYAGSPYAYHTLGSCLAVKASAYAHCRGFPKRAGAEDFYLLNKLAKLGPIAKLEGPCVELASRRSGRVPFGTGPALDVLLSNAEITDATCFYHPAGFEALRLLLKVMSDFDSREARELPALLTNAGLDSDLAHKSLQALSALGWEELLTHCRRQGYTGDQFIRNFHHWLDGFRTLRFLHQLRDAGLSPLSLAQLAGCAPDLWPRVPADKPAGDSAASAADLDKLRLEVREHWHWVG